MIEEGGVDPFSSESMELWFYHLVPLTPAAFADRFKIGMSVCLYVCPPVCLSLSLNWKNNILFSAHSDTFPLHRGRHYFYLLYVWGEIRTKPEKRWI